MQIPQSIHTGDVVEIRGRRWRVLDVCAYERCLQLTVSAIGGSFNGSIEQRFLAPFDEVVTVRHVPGGRFVGVRRWRLACRAVLAGGTPPIGLRAARRAAIDLLPHQLEPALALVSARGTRVLLADEVGLGKTIQAGLIIAELRARRQADRVLIATPAGLRDQWRAELAERFAIDAALVDYRELRRRAATSAIGVNPWITTPIAITSIDYLKRPEVLPSICACHWDVVVVDEAHGAGPGSERFVALSALARRAAYVILLTATPHSGDAQAFQSLCGIGALGDPLLIFRRTRADVKLGADRRVHRFDVQPSAAESQMYARLADFTAAVRREHDSTEAWLSLSVLHKRAFSSAASLERTVSRRLDAMGPGTHRGGQQLPLPLAEDGERDEADNPPDCLTDLALADADRERVLLRALQQAARQAAVRESKIRVIRRLIARVNDPVVIFTEYRDTLLSVASALGVPAAVLHGGLTREERRRALDDFSAGRSRILLATDAAGEGLNLHHRCRFLINLELPWNPMRLEQRIGRVDRIGQTRTVHAWHLIAKHSGEARVLERLRTRIASAQAEIAVANPIDDARRFARYAIDPDASGDHPAGAARPEVAPFTGMVRLTTDLDGAARLEAARLLRVRGLSDAGERRIVTWLDVSGPLITRTRRTPTRRRLHGRAIAILRIDREDAAGRLVHWTLVPLLVPLPPRRHSTRWMREWLQVMTPALHSFADDGPDGEAPLADAVRAMALVRLARERRIALDATAGDSPAMAHQPGLFDRRAERAWLAALGMADERAASLTARLRALEQRLIIARRPARLLLVMVP